MDPTKNYYSTLSVSEDADIEVIKAAYRALCKKYHPDKKNYHQEKSTARMQEINEAYEILANDLTRREYDLQRGKSTYTEGKEEHEDFHSDVHIEEAWQLAIEYSNELEKYYKDLAKLSQRLANTFKITLVEKKCFADAESIALMFEKDYLKRFFGSNLSAQDFAKELIQLNYTDAAKELNKIINVMGDSLDVKQAIKKISEKYNYPPSSSTEQATYSASSTEQAAYSASNTEQATYSARRNKQDSNLIKMVCKVGLCLLVLLLFIGFLASEIQDTPRDTTRTNFTEQQVDSLKLQTVNSNDTAIGNSGWVITLGKFQHEKNAQVLMSRLEKAGYRSFSRPLNNSSWSLTEVFVGPDLQKANLENALSHLNELTNLQGRVEPFRLQ